MPGLIALIRAPQRVLHHVWLQERQIEHGFDRGGRQQVVLLCGQRPHAMARLRRDHHARSALCDHFAKAIEQQRGAIKVDLQDRLDRRLRGRDARRLDQVGDFAQRSCRGDQRLYQAPRGNIDVCGMGIIARIAQNLGRRLGILGMQVGQQDCLAHPDPAPTTTTICLITASASSALPHRLWLGPPVCSGRLQP